MSRCSNMFKPKIFFNWWGLLLYISKLMFLNAKSPDQFAEFKTVYKSTFASAALLVDADLLL